MKDRRSIFIFSLFAALFLYTQTLQAQYASASVQNPYKAVKTFYPKTVNSPKKEAIRPAVRKAKRIAADYNSFVIVLQESDRPLVSTNPIFRQFGKVVYDRTEKGKYSYMICTPFTAEKHVNEFMNAVILPRFPEAHVVEYKDGTAK